MRETPGDFDPSVRDALDRAKALLGAGDVPGALTVYRTTYDRAIGRDDHYHASVVAHMAGVAEPEAAKKHRWNIDALREADAVVDRASVKGFYASLYSNLAFSQLLLGELEDALRYQQRAIECLADIEPGAYQDRVVSGATSQLERIQAQIAERVRLPASRSAA